VRALSAGHSRGKAAITMRRANVDQVAADDHSAHHVG